MKRSCTLISSRATQFKSTATILLPPPPPQPPAAASLSRGLIAQALANSAAHRHHLQIFSLSLKSGHPIHLRLATLLITRFSTSGDLAASRRLLLLSTPTADIAAWNIYISGCARHILTEPAFRSYTDLQLHSLRPDIFTLSSLLNASSHIAETQIVHALAVRTGFSSGVYVISGLLRNYSKSGDLGSAEKCFGESPIMDSVVWTAMVSGYAKNGEVGAAMDVFVQMWCLGMGLNEYCFTSVLAALADEGWRVELGMGIHGLGVKVGFLPLGSAPLCNALLSMYCRCGTREDGVRAFDEILQPDVVSWSTLLGALDGVEAREVFRSLCSRDMEMNEYTVIGVVSAISDAELLRFGDRVHGWCLKSGFLSVVPVGNAFISMYGRFKELASARQVFDEMVERDLVSWNALLAVYAANCFLGLAFALFSEMWHRSLEPNTSTLASLSEAVACTAASEQAMQIHSYLIKSGHRKDDCIAAALITAYRKCGRIDDSKLVFEEAGNQASAHVNAMAAAYVQASYPAEALKLFRACLSQGMEADCGTLSVVLKACCTLTLIEQGKSLHSLVLKLGMDSDSFIRSSVIHLYSKCGVLDDAVKVFQALPISNLATWNAMIMGYAQHGNHERVVEQFGMMLELGMHPDEITFLGLLYSCCHAGHVKEAYHYLNSMTEDHGLAPSLEHYACVIDLLGRVGCLEEAKMIIDQMPLSPDSRIWQIFLTACSIKNNLELGEVAAEELLKLEPENDAAYVLLSNICAASGMWEEVRRMRRRMRERAVLKEAGSSWIQVRGTDHSFFASDASHPLTPDIYLMLEELNGHLLDVQSDESLIYEVETAE